MMHTHSSTQINVNSRVTHRGVSCVVTACIPDPFGYLIKLEERPVSRLDYLNKLREQVGKKPLKSWKESKEKLNAAIAGIEAQVLGPVPAIEGDSYPPLAINGGATGRVTAEQKEEIFEKHASVKKRLHADAPSTFTLADAAREIDMNPKVARAKMRKAKDVPPSTGKYTWDVKHLPRIRIILRGGQ